jgi:hypothetical protein
MNLLAVLNGMLRTAAGIRGSKTTIFTAGNKICFVRLKELAYLRQEINNPLYGTDGK